MPPAENRPRGTEPPVIAAGRPAGPLLWHVGQIAPAAAVTLWDRFFQTCGKAGLVAAPAGSLSAMTITPNAAHGGPPQGKRGAGGCRGSARRGRSRGTWG